MVHLTIVDQALDAGALIQRAQTERKLDFELGVIDPFAPATEAFFLDMAEVRSQSYFGFRFQCTVPTGITEELATLLGRGGVINANLLDSSGEHAEHEPPEYLCQLETVRVLYEAGIDVRWQVSWPRVMRDPFFGRELLRTCAAASNLPPPDISEQFRHDVPRDTLTRMQAITTAWGTQFRKSTLTFARGPGFVRIRDRRPSKGGCRFYTLKAQQADILRFCSRLRTRSDIGHFAEGVPDNKVTAFLERMVTDELIARHGNYYLSLPTRRTLGERWSSEVV
ncbi:hypothetical protein HZF05_13825 [Sphingomonas sp. CGMCC 1.13654]|uniref:Uncharacterized protein n=1 Tax=Sphingomonas chungangi TaxID=2683589 RepID=A0A838L7L8_9SPHN|nr:DUF5825 family protein [Sphingomonas chungangi]MBA2935164.1 hypothetical protein [Sphingomonas chungangi]MVW57728.1 hypothetical protein [Sphingomonas chungangi]